MSLFAKKSFLLLCCFLVISSGFFAGTVFAQTDSFGDRQRTFLSMLEQYRSQKDNFTLAKEQYKQLNTLASQELAISEARLLLDLRATILLEYMDMLKTALSNTNGIPLEVKNPQLVQIDLLKEKINLHKTNLNQAVDRLQLDQETQRFVTDYEEIEGAAYFVLSIIKIGTMQVATDKLDLTRQATQDFVLTQDVSSAQKAVKERGFGEIDRAMDDLNGTFTPIKTSTFEEQSSDLAGYTNLTGDLQSVYAQIRKVINFLEEIRKKP